MQKVKGRHRLPIIGTHTETTSGLLRSGPQEISVTRTLRSPSLTTTNPFTIKADWKRTRRGGPAVTFDLRVGLERLKARKRLQSTCEYERCTRAVSSRWLSSSSPLVYNQLVVSGGSGRHDVTAPRKHKPMLCVSMVCVCRVYTLCVLH